MTTVHSLILAARRRLADAGVDSPRLDADLLVGHVLGLDRGRLIAQGERVLTADEAAAIEDLVARRAGRAPLSHLIGRREFWSLDFAVSPATLDPRPDTETLIETVLSALGGRRDQPLTLLDLGTGTGCILAALLSECPAARGLGIDVVPAAVELARRNLAALGLAHRAEVRLGDWCAGLTGRFDVIVSNPPYIPEGEMAGLAPEVRDHEPASALVGGADGLDCYRRILAEAPALLAPGGVLAVEIGYDQGPAVATLADAAGLQAVAIIADLGNRPRVVIGHQPPALSGVGQKPL